MLKLQEDWCVRDDGVLQIWRIHEAAWEVVNVLELKQRIFDELDKEGFPDLSFCFHQNL